MNNFMSKEYYTFTLGMMQLLNSNYFDFDGVAAVLVS